MKMIIKELTDWFESFLSYIPGKVGTLFRMIWFRFRWEKSANVRVRPLSQFISPKNILFEGEASLGKGAFFTAEGGQIIIGQKFSCNTNLHMNASCGGEISIGENVLIGPNVVIRTSNHNFTDRTKNINEQGHSFGNIKIEDNVWIGANCVILSNVLIGKGAVIAAGAVVNKNVDSYTVVGGVPAQKIKSI